VLVEFVAAMEPFSSGAYVNTLTDEGQAGVLRAYRADKLARRTALKDRYDPDNVFHFIHNIRPSGQSIGLSLLRPLPST
jgi:hypothetical protein